MPAQTKQRKKRKCRPGTKARRDIKKYQKGTELLGPRGPFKKLVQSHMKRVASDSARENVRGPVEYLWKKDAILKIQQAYEAQIGKKFQLCGQLAKIANRKEILPQDFAMALRIKDDLDGPFTDPHRS